MAGIFMVMMLSLVLILVFAIITVTGGDLTELSDTLGKVASTVFPRMRGEQAGPAVPTD